jgi:hypothetical protein
MPIGNGSKKVRMPVRTILSHSGKIFSFSPNGLPTGLRKEIGAYKIWAIFPVCP